MSGDQDGGVPGRQEVAAGGDAYAAGRDLIADVLPAAAGGTVVQGSQGVQVGGPGAVITQVNVFGQAGAEVAPASLGEFRADLLALVERVDDDAVRRGLPDRLVPGGDVRRMARTVRLLGGVRQATEPDGQAARMRGPGATREAAYALAAERGDRGGEPPRSWEQAAAAHDRLVVLGDPGMGKSWLLRAEAHRLAAAARRDLAGAADSGSRALVPVLVRAGVLAGLPGRTLAEAVTGYLVAEGWLPARSAGRMRDRIDGGGVVLLVDALDEVPARGSGLGSLPRVTGLLRRWAESCAGTARCVVTSRFAGYAGPPVPGAREAELLPFSQEDVGRAMEAWDLPGQAAAQLREWLEQPAVAAMARIPLLLALLCSLAGDPGRRQALPRTRTELYGAVVWQFLSGAHRGGGPSGTAEAVGEADRHALLAALTRIALAFAEASQGWVDQMPYRDLIEALHGPGDALAGAGDPPPVVLDRLVTQAGVLVPAGSPATSEQDYGFLHRTIAEYLLARHLAGLPAADRMRVVTAHQWFDPDWAEVIPMLGAMLAARNLPEARALVSHFLTARPDPFHRAFDTALRIICEAPGPDRLLTPDTGQELHSRLLRLVRPGHRRMGEEEDPPTDRLVRTLTAALAWPQAITSAILELASVSDAGLRLVAVGAPAGRAGTEALVALALASESDSKVLYTAVGALAEREGAEATSTLVTLATNSVGEVHQVAVEALAKREGAEATTALLALTTDSDLRVRWAATYALKGREGTQVTTTLVALTTDSVSDIRRAAVRALAGREGAEVTTTLLTITTDSNWSNWEVREEAARALAGREGAEVTTTLVTLTTDNDSNVRREAAEALAGREGAEVTTALVTLATDSASDVRRAAVRALTGREEAQVTTALLTLTTDSDSYVRREAAEALAGREGTQVTTAQLALITDSDWEVRRAAVYALTGREGTDVTTLVALTTDSDWDVRRKAAEALTERVGAEATTALLALITDSDWQVRRAAAYALTSRGGTDVTTTLLALTTDSDWQVRAVAAESLTGREGTQVTTALLTLTTDSGSDVRRAAAYALTGREGTQVTTALVALTTDSDSSVRLAAVRALTGREGTQVTTALLTLTTDSDSIVRLESRDALARRLDPVILDRLCRPRRWFEPSAVRRERRDLADRVADHLYVLVPPEKRPRVLRRLGRLTR
jgi:HEAT repeat protein